jgi:hypothetical protein
MKIPNSKKPIETLEFGIEKLDFKIEKYAILFI